MSWWNLRSSGTLASKWFLRIRERKVDAREDQKFSEWTAKEANQRSLEEVELAWQLAEELRRSESMQGLLVEIDRGARIRRPVRWAFGWAASAAAVAVAGTALLNYLWIARPVSVDYETSVGHQQVITLPDKSTLSLNTSTKVRVTYARNERRIDLLTGEAAFVVSRNMRRPFVVAAHGLQVRAMGTEFSVRIDALSTRVEVLEGTVQVVPLDQRDQMATVTAGMGIVYGSDKTLKESDSTQLRVRDWEAHRLVFRDAPLSEAVQEYNRYTVRPIMLADADLSQVRISGTFTIGDETSFLDALQTAFGLVIESSDTGLIRLRRRANIKSKP